MSQPPPPMPDAVVSEPVTLINAFSVPPAESERFLSRWRDNARIMAAQPDLGPTPPPTRVAFERMDPGWRDQVLPRHSDEFW